MIKLVFKKKENQSRNLNNSLFDLLKDILIKKTFFYSFYIISKAHK
jgi:hypothetical protein